MTRTAQKVSQQASKGYPIAIQGATDNVATGQAASSATSLTLAAGTQPWVLGSIVWSYSGPVTGGELQVGDSTGVLFDQYIHSGSAQNFGQIQFSPPLVSQISNSSMAITLAGSAGITGKITVTAWQEY